MRASTLVRMRGLRQCINEMRVMPRPGNLAVMEVSKATVLTLLFCVGAGAFVWFVQSLMNSRDPLKSCRIVRKPSIGQCPMHGFGWAQIGSTFYSGYSLAVIDGGQSVIFVGKVVPPLFPYKYYEVSKTAICPVGSDHTEFDLRLGASLVRLSLAEPSGDFSRMLSLR